MTSEASLGPAGLGRELAQHTPSLGSIGVLCFRGVAPGFVPMDSCQEHAEQLLAALRRKQPKPQQCRGGPIN